MEISKLKVGDELQVVVYGQVVNAVVMKQPFMSGFLWFKCWVVGVVYHINYYSLDGSITREENEFAIIKAKDILTAESK